MKGFFIFGLCLSPIAMYAQADQDTIREATIEAVSFTKRLPVAKEIINVERDLSAKNLGQDLPILLKNQTAVISTSDAGNGVGYTGFRIRGVGGTSINVMMNGVPYNDAESQGTFFVDVPDLTSSASQIVIQRGVGTSSNGVSAFGASVNIVSKNPEEEFYIKSDNSYGSFNTYKYSAEIGSGKIANDKLSLMARYTKIHSDGYIDRASSDLDSYNFTALWEEERSKFRLMAFGGNETTYQAWNGIDKKTWETNPRFNSSGAIYDENWENIVGFYDNETDNYSQNHYQFLWEQFLGSDWRLETTAHYTRGKGFYENYKQGDSFSKYNLPDLGSVTGTDFIRKKWLDNHFYGLVSNLFGRIGSTELHIGAVANNYEGLHYGDVTGVYYPEITDFEYYRNKSVKTEYAGFAKAIVKLNRIELFGDLQTRIIDYSTRIIQQGDDEGMELDRQWNFLNPKAGISYNIGNGKVFLSYAKASREPNRDDLFANPDTQAETLHDFEAGIEKSFGSNFSLAANAYLMNYVNQLVLTGEINNVGAFIRANSGKSYRAGLELSALGKLSDQWELSGNVAWSKNENLDFRSDVDGTVREYGRTPISFSPATVANLLVSYRPVRHFSIGIQNQYVGSQYLDNTGNENSRIPEYFLTDLQARYTLKLSRTEVDLKLLVNNLLDRKYVNNGFMYGADPYYFAQAGINFLFGVSFRIQ